MSSLTPEDVFALLDDARVLSLFRTAGWYSADRIPYLVTGTLAGYEEKTKRVVASLVSRGLLLMCNDGREFLYRRPSTLEILARQAAP